MTGDSNKGKIGVFWNMDDCPIPDVCNPHQFKEFVFAALENEGYLGYVSSWAYSGKTSVVENLWVDYNRADIRLSNKVFRGINGMKQDILLFILRNTAPANVLVISKDIAEDRDLMRTLGKLKSIKYNILAMQPEPVKSEALLAIISKLWLWPSQLDADTESSGVMPDSED
ncbi:unnamed protein product [Arabis nemorensis]|uniref:NYN domain-containing protein n=1 Tax=Arabis nemorensis TaxID=586526 RepID=A0A565BU02_9BRAS|nr:unnamed protein product [Arabis nemorensis]